MNIRVHTTPGDSNLIFFSLLKSRLSSFSNESCQVLAAGVSCDDRGLIVPDSLGRVS